MFNVKTDCQNQGILVCFTTSLVVTVGQPGNFKGCTRPPLASLHWKSVNFFMQQCFANMMKPLDYGS